MIQTEIPILQSGGKKIKIVQWRVVVDKHCWLATRLQHQNINSSILQWKRDANPNSQFQEGGYLPNESAQLHPIYLHIYIYIYIVTMVWILYTHILIHSHTTYLKYSIQMNINIYIYTSLPPFLLGWVNQLPFPPVPSRSAPPILGFRNSVWDFSRRLRPPSSGSSMPVHGSSLLPRCLRNGLLVPVNPQRLVIWLMVQEIPNSHLGWWLKPCK